MIQKRQTRPAKHNHSPMNARTKTPTHGQPDTAAHNFGLAHTSTRDTGDSLSAELLSGAATAHDLGAATNMPHKLPEILAPAGDTHSFLAALAAGADAVYVGLKHFSARAGADNFSTTELSRMVDLAEREGRKVYIAFNSLVKPDDMASAGRLMLRMARDAKPHALIIQDPGLIELARQAGYEGELHLSTLANVTHPAALHAAHDLGVSRVILPRELTIDEVRDCAQSAPEGLDLELFVHGALCWCVSGRCYWSSYLGGKSGLRGRCVQPCRRVYNQNKHEGRYFSCQDLSLDVLVKALFDIPKLSCWKIEGRKKGPHYVYHTVAAYRLLRDALATRRTMHDLDEHDGSDWARARKDAEALLEMALGRPRTHANFLPQRGKSVSTPNEPTSSGMLVGKIQFGQDEFHQPFIKTRMPLLPKDLLRIGYEDEVWHDTVPVTHRTPKAGSYLLRLARHKTPRSGTPVFLIDRKEPELMAILNEWEKKLARSRARETTEAVFEPQLPAPSRLRKLPDMQVRSTQPQGKETRSGRSTLTGLWLNANAVRATSRTIANRYSWWLPPVIWPNEEATWKRVIVEAIRNGVRHFVCNSPWQIALFPSSVTAALSTNFHAENAEEAEARAELRAKHSGPRKRPEETVSLIAGPFCNVANAACVAVLAKMGYKAAIVAPELNSADLLALPRQCCLPLGIVLSGFWPAGIARHSLNHLRANEVFSSPKGEPFWARNYGQNLWIYPGWPLDITEHRPQLENAGYAFFAHMVENPPASLPTARRSSDFNWGNDLL